MNATSRCEMKARGPIQQEPACTESWRAGGSMRIAQPSHTDDREGNVDHPIPLHSKYSQELQYDSSRMHEELRSGLRIC